MTKRKVIIKAMPTPKKVLMRGGGSFYTENPHSNYDETTRSIHSSFPLAFRNEDYTKQGKVKNFDGDEIGKTIKSVPEDIANAEVESGEYIWKANGEFYSIKGKKHSKGGTPIVAEQGDFIFSSSSLLKGDGLKYFYPQIKDGDKRLKEGVSFASLASKYADLNDYIHLLTNNDPFEQDTARVMMDEYNKGLATIAFAQEKEKGFEGGFPQRIADIIPELAGDPEGSQSQNPQGSFKRGGSYDRYKYAAGGPINKKYYNPKSSEYFQRMDSVENNEDYKGYVTKDENGLARMAKGPELVVLHHTGGDLKSSMARFNKGDASAHVIIDADGTAYVLGDPNQVAKHAGVSYYNGQKAINKNSIGIEFVSPGETKGWKPNAKQLSAFNEYMGYVNKEYGMSFKPEQIVTHTDITSNDDLHEHYSEYAKKNNLKKGKGYHRKGDLSEVAKQYVLGNYNPTYNNAPVEPINGNKQQATQQPKTGFVKPDRTVHNPRMMMDRPNNDGNAANYTPSAENSRLSRIQNEQGMTSNNNQQPIRKAPMQFVPEKITGNPYGMEYITPSYTSPVGNSAPVVPVTSNQTPPQTTNVANNQQNPAVKAPMPFVPYDDNPLNTYLGMMGRYMDPQYFADPNNVPVYIPPSQPTQQTPAQQNTGVPAQQTTNVANNQQQPSVTPQTTPTGKKPYGTTFKTFKGYTAPDGLTPSDFYALPGVVDELEVNQRYPKAIDDEIWGPEHQNAYDNYRNRTKTTENINVTSKGIQTVSPPAKPGPQQLPETKPGYPYPALGEGTARDNYTTKSGYLPADLINIAGAAMSTPYYTPQPIREQVSPRYIENRDESAQYAVNQVNNQAYRAGQQLDAGQYNPAARAAIMSSILGQSSEAISGITGQVNARNQASSEQVSAQNAGIYNQANQMNAQMDNIYNREVASYYDFKGAQRDNYTKNVGNSIKNAMGNQMNMNLLKEMNANFLYNPDGSLTFIPNYNTSYGGYSDNNSSIDAAVAKFDKANPKAAAELNYNQRVDLVKQLKR
jgi:hypothetical protein